MKLFYNIITISTIRGVQYKQSEPQDLVLHGKITLHIYSFDIYTA